ncbi:MAG: histidine ammonia-lyase [Francisellaceae bacterium]
MNDIVDLPMNTCYTLKPGQLSLHDIEQLLYSDRKLKLDSSDLKRVSASCNKVKEISHGKKSVYGINTGFGMLAQTKIDQMDLKSLQRKIVLSHAAGVGRPLDPIIVKLVMLLKINSLAQGYSGISPETLTLLISLYNHKIYPIIPEKGSVGASGDLAPLAHMSLALIGEGEVCFQGRRIKAHDALLQCQLAPVELIEKEGLALLNGTQVSTAIAIIALFNTMKCFATASIAGAMSIEATKGSIKPFHPEIARLKRLKGQIIFSRVMTKLLNDSEIMRSHTQCQKVQDPYSLRCQPQVMGAAWQLIASSAENLINEANAVSDNPLILADDDEIISGGNFHAEIVAMSADMLAIAASEIGAISERRIALLVDKTMSGLPAFLVNDAGVNSGFMLAQVTASALASENKTLAHPASIDSLPTSANQEDHVSMATFAARKALTISDNIASIIAIETLAACQGIDFHKPLKPATALLSYYNQLRSQVAFYDEDRYFAEDIEQACLALSRIEYYHSAMSLLFADILSTTHMESSHD